MFVREENFKTFLRLYPIISAITGIHLIVFLLANLGPQADFIYYYFTGSNYFISQGEYWRLFTPIITHVSLSHVLFNTFSLVIFGPALERILGKVKFIIGYLGAGIIADIATYFLLPLNYAHIGASGAIFGLFGIYLYILYARKEYLGRANKQILIVVLVFSLITTFTTPGINILGHLFGLIAGAALAPMLMAFVPRRR
ncbi:Membrane associated serine protease, rhomboid family [Fictibacillus solisalsi]|uniref:Membrane associated serine protease, rhomboid family n=1 Tax=Fictibacillus solisalsi TaxID=459525 RepID=A0A1H0CBI7_9BACL|nr:rhomboid family intramembrane serine protease [Fictibacillus solisalsi]SDN55239.1 Membrane associated serine protease, rhomboid family [Fictibacillus solisalsi]